MNSSHLALIGPLGGPEMIMIMIVILLLFGAKKLPELARGVGKSMGEFKRARDEFEREITRSEVEVSRDDRNADRIREEKLREEREHTARVTPSVTTERHDT